MSEENKLEPSRWSPPADLAQAYNEGKATKRLPDGSTASLSWIPEMNNRWWSYDGAIWFGDGLQVWFGDGLQVIDHSSYGPQVILYPSARGGNGTMLVPDSEIKHELVIASKMEPFGQPWSYSPQDTRILEIPARSLHTRISWLDTLPAILVSHDGRIILEEYYHNSTYSSYTIREIMETNEQREFYVDRLFKLLYSYLRLSPRDSWTQPSIISTSPNGRKSKLHEIIHRARGMWKLVDSKRIELVKKPRCAKLRNLKEWILALPSWASMIVAARLANAGSLSLIAGDARKIRMGNSKKTIDLTNIACLEANVANRCYNLLVLSNEKIYNNSKSMSYEELALEYGPCWLMQSLIALDRSPDDTLTSLDLVHNNDHWETNINRDRVRAACKLAGAMNAPIELWPRFYSILENLSESALDEVTVLITLATPPCKWDMLSKALDVTSGQAKLIREACCLITADMIRSGIRTLDEINDVEQAIIGALSPVRPIASQIVDLTMSLDDAIDSVALRSCIVNYNMKLITDKPIMTDTINGISLIASDLNKLNINEN